MLYDAEDRMPRLEFCREYGINPETEKLARAHRLPWPPWIVLVRSVVYSRQRCAEWFAEQDRRSQGAVIGD